MSNNISMFNWGGLKFSRFTLAPDTLKTSDAYRWATVERIGKETRPAKQFVGPGERTITMDGVIFGMFNPGGGDTYVGTRQLEAFRAKAATGMPYLLQDGRGDVLGKFCLVKIDETGSVLIDTGAPRKQTFTLSFELYGGE